MILVPAATALCAFLVVADPGFIQGQPQPCNQPPYQNQPFPYQNQQSPNQNQQPCRRGEPGLPQIAGMVNRMIRVLQNDPKDYDGYRVKTIQDLEQAAADLQKAIASDPSLQQPQRYPQQQP